MQGILISLATAVILAIGGAFAAPFVVDWNAWRGTFETEMGRTLGLPVVIRGPIDAEILPAPRIRLRDVTLGDVVSTGGTVRELKAELSLGALLRGEVEATGVTLDRPQIRLVLDSAGRLALPTGTGRAADLSIARFEVKDGAIDLLDRASDHTFSFTDLDLKGEARSLSGPFRLDGEVETAGARFALRSTLGKIGSDGAGRLRIVLDGRTRPFGLDLDGTLNVAEAKPRFDGRAALARHGGEGLDAWRLSGTLKASPDAVLAENLDLAIGGSATPAQLSGSARLSLGRAIGLDAVLNARSLDFDALRGDPGKGDADASAGPAEALARFLAAVGRLPVPDIASRIGLASDQLMLGGTLLRDVRADISGSSAGWRLDNAEAQLPGKASLRLSGVPTRAAKQTDARPTDARPTDARPADAKAGDARTSDPKAARPGAPADGFDGALTFTADDPAAFLRWAAPSAAREYVAAAKGPVRITGRISAAPGRVAVDGLDAAFGASRMKGTASVGLPAGAAPKLNVRLSLDGFDLDPLVAAMQQAAATAGGGADGIFLIDGRNLTVAGLPLRALTLDATATGGNWRLARMLADDLGGIRLEGAGRMENFSTTPRGEFNFAISGPRADGLVPVARLVAGDRTAEVLTRLLPIAAPVKLSSTVVWGEAGGRNISVAGTLGQISGDIAFTRSIAGVPLRVALKADLSDGARALSALGLEGIAPRAGPARMELSVEPMTQGEAHVRGRLALADMSAQGDGRVRISTEGLEPDIAMRLDGPDLGRILPQAGAAADGPVPTALAFALSRNGPAWRLGGLSGSLAGAPVSGTLDIEPGSVPRFSGALAFDTLSVPRLIGLFGTRAEAGGAAGGLWSPARLGGPSVSGVSLALDLTAARLAVVGPYALTGARLRLSGDAADLDLRDMSGAMGGGRAMAGLRLRRQGEGIEASGRLVLEQVEADALISATGARTPPRGRVNLTLDLGGSGRSVLGVVQTLSGQGTLAVRNLVIEGANPAALDAVLAETAMLPAPPDERRTAQMLDRALQKGPLRLPMAESTLGIVNGVVRLSPARTTADGVRVGLSGSLDLTRLMMDGAVDLEGAEASGAVPGGNVSWRGSLTAPERRVAAPALTSVVAMRAIERETRRLEERQARTTPAATPPAPPATVTPPPAVTPAPVAVPVPESPPPAPRASAPPAAPPSEPVATPQAPPPAVAAPIQIAPAPPVAAAPPPPQPQPVERREAPGFGAPAGAGTPAGTGTAAPAAPPVARQDNHPETRPEAAPRPAAQRPATPATPRRTERTLPELPPRIVVPLPSESTLPPTRGFGDLPRPPGLVGQ
ncbi:AsmA family protein [Xanthobacter sp. AM11]|uniref:AsmA family protein n=1 Tax=Xanthobacter sp. AM11 TaxID=3380643 RepID=UPI0039BF3A98